MAVRAFREKNQRHVFRDRIVLQRVRDLRQIAQAEFTEHRRREQAAPGVEHHQRLRTRGGLRGEIRGDRARDHVEQTMHRLGFFQRERLRPREARRTFAFDHVAGERPRTAGETDQRHLAAEFAADQAHRVHHVAQIGFRIGDAERIDLGARAHRLGQTRTHAFVDRQAQTHRIRNRQDVGEQNRRIERVARDRLQGDFAGQFRRLA